MASDRLYRATAVDLEIRGGDGRTVCGIACPFGEPATIPDPNGGSYEEVFVRGAFSRTIAERGPGRVKFLAQHDARSMPLGRATLLREDAAGLYGEFRVSATRAGDEALALIADQALDGLSVGFKPVSQQRNGSVLERTSVALSEVSAVTFGAYVGATISGIRGDQLEELERRLAALTNVQNRTLPVLPVDVARRRLALLSLESRYHHV